MIRRKADFTGAPAFKVYRAGAEELEYHPKHNSVRVKGALRISRPTL